MENGDEEQFSNYRSVQLLMWAALREKVPNVLSCCHTKLCRGARGRARHYFVSKPTFKKKKKKKKSNKISTYDNNSGH